MALSTSCGNTTSGESGSGTLLGTWTLMTTPMGSGAAVQTMVMVAQDSLTITSPDFTLTAARTGNALTFIDHDSPGGSSTESLTATQTAGTFNAGLVPFDLGGHWTMQAGPTGGSPVVSCTLDVSASEIDGSCQNLTSPAGPWFNFTTTKMTSAASGFGDLGGTWNNVWTSPGPNGGTYPCTLTFTGNSITTCAQGPMNTISSILSGITFTYDGANTVSGAAQGWVEYSATR
jgi:hypothetical protein